MKKNLTELVFILDRSGSMHGLEQDTIGGFNAMLEKQKRAEGEAFVTTVLFDNESKMLHDRVEIEKVPPMTSKDYTAGGCTALLDAVGETVGHIADIHRYARPEDVPENTVVVIITDGMENASRRYSASDVKRLIARKKEENGWEFLFLGANIDAVETAGSMGIEADHAVDYCCDAEGTQLNYKVINKAVSCLRQSAPLCADWADEIKRDRAKRG